MQPAGSTSIARKYSSLEGAGAGNEHHVPNAHEGAGIWAHLLLEALGCGLPVHPLKGPAVDLQVRQLSMGRQAGRGRQGARGAAWRGGGCGLGVNELIVQGFAAGNKREVVQACVLSLWLLTKGNVGVHQGREGQSVEQRADAAADAGARGMPPQCMLALGSVVVWHRLDAECAHSMASKGWLV